MRLRSLSVTVAACVLALPLVATPALADGADAHKQMRAGLAAPATEGEGVNMTAVENLPYAPVTSPTAAPNGSDIEFAKIAGTEYAFAGTLRQGLQIIDIDDPAAPEVVTVFDCRINQGDVQVFKQGTRVLATYTADSRIDSGAGWASSACVREARALGFAVQGSDLGTFLVDVTNPAAPRTVSFLRETAGSHNMTVHPSGDFLYNSNSDLVGTRLVPYVTIFDIRQPDAPKEVGKYPLPFIPTSLGSEAHDVTFNEVGDRAYVAALSQTLILDTTDPAKPVQVAQIVDPAIQVVHQSDPVTVKAADGSEREMLIITDERAGAAGAAECPGGGLHVYDITDEKNPVKQGAWFIDAIEPVTPSTALPACTSHVLRIYEEQQLLTIGWYIKGVRVLDISGLGTLPPVAVPPVAFGDGVGMKEVGSFVFPDSDTWSFKTNKIAADGSFFGYGNDMARGLDVYRFQGLGGRSVPPLEPVDLLPGAKVEDERSELLGVLPLSGGTAAGGLGLLALAVVAGNVALVRRSRPVAV